MKPPKTTKFYIAGKPGLEWSKLDLQMANFYKSPQEARTALDYAPMSEDYIIYEVSIKPL